MVEVVKLRQVRKAKARRDHEAKAAANRALHGRTKGERAAEAAAHAKLERTLAGARRED
ncbi:DUF4169 family protein [Sphingosinithalassobacter sp. CS137]|uniref:DUF4169 family protein n=1 Tax=Sphingosinithalassobacter sp. CS137 TaxID=2762748 RepID=UPI00165D559D|nr:DUF4169 family protein [Sphingosinithalassobacter sp. CS137]